MDEWAKKIPGVVGMFDGVYIIAKPLEDA